MYHTLSFLQLLFIRHIRIYLRRNFTCSIRTDKTLNINIRNTLTRQAFTLKLCLFGVPADQPGNSISLYFNILFNENLLTPTFSCRQSQSNIGRCKLSASVSLKHRYTDNLDYVLKLVIAWLRFSLQLSAWQVNTYISWGISYR